MHIMSMSIESTFSFCHISDNHVWKKQSYDLLEAESCKKRNENDCTMVKIYTQSKIYRSLKRVQ
jgi:hypothetical protein